MSSGHPFISAIRATLVSQRELAERAIAQVDDDALRRPLDENTNSIAIIMKHVGGSLRSRFVGFLASDGEKPDRQRDREFVDEFAPGAAGRAEAVAHWNAGFDAMLGAIDALTPADLEATVRIRGEPHSVPLALERALGHVSYHIGQIVIIARIHSRERWSTLTIERGGSDAFNRSKGFDPSAKPER